MKKFIKILPILILFSSAGLAQTPQTSYVLPTINAMKGYTGKANRVYVIEKNQDYVPCNACVVNDQTVFQGSNGTKWGKVTDSSVVSMISNKDTSSYHTTTQIDSAIFSLNRPNGSKTIFILEGDTVYSNQSGIQSVQAGTNITVDNTDPLNPIVNAAGGGSASRFGIEDNVGVQDRFVHFEDKSFKIGFGDDTSFINTAASFRGDTTGFDIYAAGTTYLTNNSGLTIDSTQIFLNSNRNYVGGYSAFSRLFLNDEFYGQSQYTDPGNNNVHGEIRTNGFNSIISSQYNDAASINKQSGAYINVTSDGTDGDNINSYIDLYITKGNLTNHISGLSIDTIGLHYANYNRNTGVTYNINSPLLTSNVTLTLPVSVNGNFADSTGNITISAGGSYTLPTASSTILGGVKVGTGLAIDGSGVLSSSITASNGLTKVGSDIQLGGTLTKTTSITQAGFSISFSNIVSNGINAVSISNVGNGTGLQVNTSNANSITGTSSTQNGVVGTATSGGGYGVLGIGITGGIRGISNSTANAGYFETVGDDLGTIHQAVKIYRASTTTPANGAGSSLAYIGSTTGSNIQVKNELISKWLDANDATRTSQFSITGVDAGTTRTLMTADGNGQIKMLGEGTPTYTLEVANSTNAAIFAHSTNNFGLSAQSQNTEAIGATILPSTTSDVKPVLLLSRGIGVAGAGANGIGLSVDFKNEASDLFIYQSNQLISKWVDATATTRTSEFSITGVNNAITNTLLQISGAGVFTLTQGLTNYTDNAAAIAGGLTVGQLYRNGDIVQIVH